MTFKREYDISANLPGKQGLRDLSQTTTDLLKVSILAEEANRKCFERAPNMPSAQTSDLETLRNRFGKLRQMADTLQETLGNDDAKKYYERTVEITDYWDRYLGREIGKKEDTSQRRTI